jgi:hypothetical protein
MSRESTVMFVKHSHRFIVSPYTLAAHKLGYNSLIDMAQLTISFHLTVLTLMSAKRMPM